MPDMLGIPKGSGSWFQQWHVLTHWAEEIAAGTVGVADPQLVVEPIR